MPKFKSLVNIGLLYKIAEQGDEEKKIKKLLQESNLSDLEQRIMSEALAKVNELQRILIRMSGGKFNKDDAGNVIPPMIRWVNENIQKTGNRRTKKVLLRVKSLAKNILGRFTSFDKMEKAGTPGRSGRQKGYRFDPTKHPRDEGGKFKSKGKPSKAKGPPVTETGRRLPSYHIVGGRRVGRGIQRVPEKFGPAMARLGGHVVSGAFERAIGIPIEATGEPIKAGRMAAQRVRSKYAREKAVREALERALANPKTSNKDKKKIMSTLKTMEAKSMKATGRPKYTPIASVMDQLSEGIKAGAKSLPYSLTVGAIQGALRGVVERFRTNPMLAPLDVRVRPDILESGLRTGVAYLKDRNIERVGEIVDKAKEENRYLSPEEYGQIVTLTKLPSEERTSIIEMARGLEALAEKTKPTAKDMEDAMLLERQIERVIGMSLYDSVKDKIREAEPYLPAPAKRQMKRTKAKADIPAYEFTEEDIKNAERLLIELKGKKKKGKEK